MCRAGGPRRQREFNLASSAWLAATATSAHLQTSLTKAQARAALSSRYESGHTCDRRLLPRQASVNMKFGLVAVAQGAPLAAVRAHCKRFWDTTPQIMKLH